MKPLANAQLYNLKMRCQQQLAFALPLLEKQGKFQHVEIWYDGYSHPFEVYNHTFTYFRFDEDMNCPLFFDGKRWDYVLNLEITELCAASDWALVLLSM